MPNIKNFITASAMFAAATSLSIATPALARPFAGEGTELPPCSTLQTYIVQATRGHPVLKAHAIIGLTGPEAHDEFARIQRAVAASCG